MKDDSIFNKAYHQVLAELPELNDTERQLSFQDESWKLNLIYFYKFNHFQLEFDVKSLTASMEYPNFDLYKKPMKLFGLFTIGLDSGHLDGKMSELSDHFCELKTIDFLLDLTDAHLGWKDGRMQYIVKLDKKLQEKMIHVFDCLDFNCKHSESLLEIN